MVRECKLAYITRAGVEVGVASTKAFTTQLAALFLLTLTLAQVNGRLSEQESRTYLKQMRHLPVALSSVLALEPQIIAWAEEFARKENALFLGRGMHYPIALEGALKLKEISYIHAEAYPAGELKHGPLALVTEEMPVVTDRPERRPAGKAEVEHAGSARPRRPAVCVRRRRFPASPRARAARDPPAGALRPAVADPARGGAAAAGVSHGAGAGTDVDKPRNLAKSVTVE
jgi:glucosamine--fructose-6-phosphate aminotransferase (isomerizing)